ncbi:MAG: tetratricopeptide repeat protein [Terriglobales bacterium]
MNPFPAITTRLKFGVVHLALIVLLSGASPLAHGVDLRLSLPKGSRATPVQQLNRDGVKELKRGHVNKAKERFVKAYLLDPDDPFTLNNLGYIAELEGDVDRALKYYQLAANTSTEAVIDDASKKGLKGQPVNMAFQSSQTSEFPGNKANFRAMTLLEKGRVFEAEAVLKTAIQADPKNPFLLDSLGYVMESEGDLQAALQYYSEAASLHSEERVLLTPLKRWRGKTISEIAARNAEVIREELAKGESTDAQVARLNLRGVVALNHNDSTHAREFFADAYQLDPQNAFTLNNLGFIDELNGDRETAEMYYEAARTAREANERVTYATRADAEGRKVGPLAETNQDAVNDTLKAIQLTKRRARRPIQLMLRDTGAPPSASEPKQQPPLGVPTPPLPPPQLPDRDVTPQGTQPSVPPGAPQLQPPTPSPAPPASQTSGSPQADE